LYHFARYNKTEYGGMVSRAFDRARTRKLNTARWYDTDDVTHKAKHRAFQVYLAGGGGMKAVPKSMKGNAVCRTCNEPWKTVMKDQYASSDDEDGLRIRESTCWRLYEEDMAREHGSGYGRSDCDSDDDYY
jgi:hypothetical protein